MTNDFEWRQMASWRWALVHLPTDTSVSVIVNAQGVLERHGHEYESLDAAQAATEAWAPNCIARHGKLPDDTHRG